MSEIALFENDEFRIEIRLHPTDGFRVWAPVVARNLGFHSARDLLRTIPDAQKGWELAPTPGGEQRVSYLTEGGFYRALGQRQAQRVHDDDARAFVARFQDWVFGDVLPRLRRGELVPEQRQGPTPALPRNYAEALRELAETVEQRERAENKVAELTPAAHSWETLAQSNADYNIADTAKILANDPSIDIGRDRLWDLLAELGWIFRGGDKKWHAYQREIERGRLRTRPRSFLHPETKRRTDGAPEIRCTVKAVQWLHAHEGGTAQIQYPVEQLVLTAGDPR